MGNLTHVWGGPVKKICPKCMILGTSEVIWGDLGSSGVILESRITVCNKTFCQIQFSPEFGELHIKGNPLR